MKPTGGDRRWAKRHKTRVPLRIRLWKTATPEQRGESENLSQEGIFFATNQAIPVGAVVEILLKMPEEITGEPTTEWLCSGHVVRIEPVDLPRGKFGVGVQFDCCQIPRSRRDEGRKLAALQGLREEFLQEEFRGQRTK